MQNPLAKLSLDHWYKVMILIGAFIFLLNGAGLLPAYPTATTGFISSGLFFWGLGEWMNHPYQEVLTLDPFNRPTGKISGHPRNTCLTGNIFDLIGFVLIITGLIKLF
ncbi:hypothetical protein DLP94_08325 [Salmonella enterica]|nr:hypothetical protein [Salmonella enterica]